MKTLSKFSLLIFFSLVFATVVQAASVPETILLASVNIEGTQIVSQKDNVFNISFSLTNGEGLQTGVKYGVRLVKETDKGQFIMDEEIYDESLTLNPNSIIKKDIVYTAPTSVGGEYTLVLISNNKNGFPFGIADIGKVKLIATTDGIELLPETCSLKVVGEDAIYTLTQGVDIKSAEDLSLTCTAINSSKKDTTATQKFETRYRSSYGDIVDQTGGDTTPVVFKAGEKKTFSLIIPKASVPQAYNLRLTLGQSNPISLHYVLRGNSATIQSVSLDKDYYMKGDTALVSFVYSHSADSFQGSRFGSSLPQALSGKVSVVDGKDNACSENLTENLNNDSIKADVSVQILSDCIDPKIIILLTDSTGTVLDQKEFVVKTTSLPSQSSNNNLIYIIIGVIVLIIIIISIIMKKKNSTASMNVPMSILFILILSFVLLPKGEAQAKTFGFGSTTIVVNSSNVSDNGSNGSSWSGAPSLFPNGGINVSGSITNTSSGTPYGFSSTIRASTAAASGSSHGDYKSVYANMVQTPQTLTAPAFNGTQYLILFDISVYNVGSTTYKIPFSTYPAPTVTVYGNGVTNPKIPYGGTVEIKWKSMYAKICSCSYGGTGCTPQGSSASKVDGSDFIYASGNPYTLTSDKTFTVTCTN